METPKILKIIGVVLLGFGILRTLFGVFVLLGLERTVTTPDIIKAIIWDNFLAGTLIWVSGLLLLKGKAIGRYLLIIAVIVSWFTNFIFFGEYTIVPQIIFGVIILVLFVEDSIRAYFADKA